MKSSIYELKKKIEVLDMIAEALKGKRIIITGANSGIGYEAAKVLASYGAHVILAVRNQTKGEDAADTIKSQYKDATVEVLSLNLAELDSVRTFVQEYSARYENLDILINNAGVMMPPHQKTKDGFELQFGSNHLGHFALTGLLLPLLKRTPNSRIVTVSSLAHRRASIYFDNLDGSKGYRPKRFYNQSKLANLLFAKELDERLKEHDISTISLACHPGIASSNIFKIGKKDTPDLLKKILSMLFQSALMGALPTIFAATDDNLIGGEYIGPDGKGNRTGYPTIEMPAEGVYNKKTMKELWRISEELTGVVYDFS